MFGDKKKVKEVTVVTFPDAWMVTFSDLVTLMLTFFVLLLTMSHMDAEKAAIMFQSMIDQNSGINPVENTQRLMPATQELTEHVPPPPHQTVRGNSPKELHQNLMRWIENNQLSQSLSIKQEGKDLVIRITDDISFENGSATIPPKLRPVLTTLATLLSGYEDHSLRVDTFCRADEMENEDAMSSLSLRRATALTESLHKLSKTDNIISLMGYPRPPTPNETDQGLVVFTIKKEK